MATSEEIWNWITNYKQQRSECEKQIERLQPIYDELGELKDSLKAVRKKTEETFEEEVKWSGEKHSSFCNSGVQLDGDIKSYYNQLDAAQDAVNKRIADYKAKKYELIPIINGLVETYEDLKTSVQNAVN